jgi:hypothetical protein
MLENQPNASVPDPVGATSSMTANWTVVIGATSKPNASIASAIVGIESASRAGTMPTSANALSAGISSPGAWRHPRRP